MSIMEAVSMVLEEQQSELAVCGRLKVLLAMGHTAVHGRPCAPATSVAHLGEGELDCLREHALPLIDDDATLFALKLR